MGASRLPGKVLREIADRPMLLRVVERACRAKTLSSVVVATTLEPSDDPIVDLCIQHGVPWARGSLHDVLDRYIQAARQFEADVIVRITADCPLIDPRLIDRTVQAFWGQVQPPDRQLIPNGQIAAITGEPFDFAANRLPPPWKRTYPIGLDVEVCSRAGLETCWREAVELHHREHVMPYFYDHPERFRIVLVNDNEDYGSLRWTVDTPEDLELLQKIYAAFPGRDDFSWLEVLDLFKRQPELAAINAGTVHKDYREVDLRAGWGDTGKK